MNNNKEVIVVIGGTGGIGTAIVHEYSKRENSLIVIGDRNEPNMEDDLMKKENVSYHYLDLLDVDSIELFARTMDEQYGTITHMVCSAGGAFREEFDGLDKIPLDVLQNSLNLNLNNIIFMTQTLLPLMEKSQAEDKSITVISSINAIKCYGLPVYSAAKAGLIGFVRSMVNELGQRSIRINAVLPGSVITPRTDTEPRDIVKLLEGAALKRVTTSTEIANVIYAVTNLMTCITGQTIVADCGQSVKSYS